MKRLLVVVDYQNDFVNGALGFKKAEEIEQGIYDKVNDYLNNGDKVVFTYDTHYENYLETREGIKLPVPHCIIGSDGHELYGRLVEFKNKENTIHLNKEAFGIAPKDMVKLQEELGNSIETIEFVGVVTNMCVISNVVTFQSAYVNSQIVVDGSLCASFDEKLHKEALEVMSSLQAVVK